MSAYRPPRNELCPDCVHSKDVSAGIQHDALPSHSLDHVPLHPDFLYYESTILSRPPPFYLVHKIPPSRTYHFLANATLSSCTKHIRCLTSHRCEEGERVRQCLRTTHKSKTRLLWQAAGGEHNCRELGRVSKKEGEKGAVGEA